MEHKYFYNRLLFWQFVKQSCKGLDLNRTLRLPTLYFSDGEKDYHSRSMKHTLEQLNEVFGTDFNTKLSINRGQRFTLFFNNPEKQTTDLDVDWDKLWSFKDDSKKRASKDALEQYVKSNFNIDLNKSNVFDDMIEEFKVLVNKNS